MRGILLKTGIISLFSILVMYMYYFVFAFHRESFSGSYIFYISLLGIMYSLYKFFYVQFSEDSYKFWPLMIWMLGLGHLFVFCLVFFSLNSLPLGYSLILFFKIVFFSILPTILFFISHSFWEFCLWFIPKFEEEKRIFRVALSLWIGFTLYVTGLILLAFIWQFTAIPFIIYTAGIIGISYKNIIKNTKEFFWLSWELPLHDFTSGNIFKWIQPYTLSTEFLFIVITALISTNLINIMRPFPIGWDDLWVYMNYANLIGSSGHIPFLWQMVTWQTFTAVGFTLGSTTQAFFLNSFSGIISVLAVIFWIQFLIRPEEGNKLLSTLHLEKQTKSFISIPLLVGAIYLSLPMVIFHLAKDMKLDQGLFFISITSVVGLYHVLLTNTDRKKKLNLLYLFIIGIIVWFAFSIKLTTLLLISWIIGGIVFSEMGFLWFIGYIFTFFWIFTKLHLWDFLNVVYPKENVSEINTLSYIFFALWIFCIGLSIRKEWKNKLKEWLINTSVFLLWVIVILTPWISRNIHSLGTTNLSLNSIISGQSESYIPDYASIRWKEYVDAKNLEATSITSSWKTLNEDFWRYFWYENGINNYIKIFWNVSMQVNQKWEFTEISYIFFALIPALFLFLPIKRKIYEYGIYSILVFSVLLFMIASTSNIFTQLFSKLDIPLGYIFVLLPFVGYVFFSIKATDETQNNRQIKIFKMNSIVLSFYTFLWAISAFGIVWYGMTMYLFFLVVIGICLSFVNYYQWNEKTQENLQKSIATYSIFLIVCVYFLFSSFPHLLSNIQTAWYSDYKIWTVGEKEAIFETHPEYLDFLYNLNIDTSKQKEFLDIYKNKFIKWLWETSEEQQLRGIIQWVESIDMLVNIFKNIENSEQITNLEIKSNAKNTREEIYVWLTYPNKDVKSNAIIYRAWTFLKYFISENQKRIFEDSLLTAFEDYIYDKDTHIITDRLKKLQVSEILLDLNAATIDNDPRKDLTKRYENMLSYLTSDDVEYISWDSICFETALDEYRNSAKTTSDKEKFLLLAGVNYDSVGKDGQTISKSKKITDCFYEIKKLVDNNQVTDKSPELLKNVYNYVKNPENWITTTQNWINKIGPVMNPWYKVLFRIK